MWVDVAEAAFPTDAFGLRSDQWIERYVNQQAQLYAALNEPDGPGTGGTIVGQLVRGDLMNDLQRLIARTVEALIPMDRKKDYIRWEGRWKAAQP